MLACKDWRDILQQLIDSKAYVDFNQGVDIRLMTEEKAEMLSRIKLKTVHFAYDRYQDKKIIEPKFRTFREVSGWGRSKVQVYVLTNFDTTPEQDLHRIMFLKSLDFAPYVMVYNKTNVRRGDSISTFKDTSTTDSCSGLSTALTSTNRGANQSSIGKLYQKYNYIIGRNSYKE